MPLSHQRNATSWLARSNENLPDRQPRAALGGAARFLFLHLQRPFGKTGEDASAGLLLPAVIPLAQRRPD
jgi:hypothetical protein